MAVYALPSFIQVMSTRSLAYSREPQIAWTVSGGAQTPWAARGSTNATTAQPARSRRTADGTMMALGERLGVPQTYPPGPIVEDWTDARFGSTFPAPFLFHRWDGAR